MQTARRVLLSHTIILMSICSVDPANAHQSWSTKYKKNGEKVVVYTTRKGITLINYRKDLTIVFPLKGSPKGSFLFPWARYPHNKDSESACEFEAVNDSADHVFTTCSGFKFDEEKLGGTPRIYISKLEQDLLEEGVAHYFGDHPGKIPARKNQNPHLIWFFICITEAHHYHALHGL